MSGALSTMFADLAFPMPSEDLRRRTRFAFLTKPAEPYIQQRIVARMSLVRGRRFPSSCPSEGVFVTMELADIGPQPQGSAGKSQ